jgi:Flp pilus assembly protein TadB
MGGMGGMGAAEHAMLSPAQRTAMLRHGIAGWGAALAAAAVAVLVLAVLVLAVPVLAAASRLRRRRRRRLLRRSRMVWSPYPALGTVGACLCHLCLRADRAQ